VKSMVEGVGQRFKQVVEQAVQPVRAEQQRGIMAIYQHSAIEAQRRLPIAGDVIVFSAFRSDAVGQEGGLQGLDFIPSHGIEVIRPGTYGRTDTQTMFGLAEDSTIVRSHMVRSEFIGPVVNRILEPDESEALIDYVTSPHLNQHRLAVALQLTEGEEQIIARELARDADASAELQQQLEAIKNAQRRVWIDTKDTPLN
jgi:hypothetical protein